MLIPKNVGFERLKVFYFVFSQKSVIAAAKALNVSQSAVSQSIQKLEIELKSRLFTRLHKQLIPTTVGERLFAVVKPFMAELDICLRTFDQAKTQPFGELRIGLPVEFGKTYFPAIVAEFRIRYPDVIFYLKLGDPDTLLTQLKKGQIDFALVDIFKTQNPYSGNLDMYHCQPLAQEEIILACSHHYYGIFIKNNHSFQHLAKQDFIAYRRNSQIIPTWFKHHFGKSTDSLKTVLTIDSHQAIISAIQHHVGMGIIASHLVQKEMKTGQIIGIKTSKPESKNQISLIQLLDKVPTLTEKVFLNFLLEKMASIGLQMQIKIED